MRSSFRRVPILCADDPYEIDSTNDVLNLSSNGFVWWYGRPIYGTSRQGDSLWMATGYIWNGPPVSVWPWSLCSSFIPSWPQRCQPQCCNRAGKGKMVDLP